MKSIIVLDIETFPIVGATFGFYETTIDEIIERPKLACFAYKELGKKKVYVHALPDFKGYKAGEANDELLVKRLWEVLDKYDIVIGHNAKKFDLKMANYFFKMYKLEPPRTYPYTIVDTLTEYKKSSMYPAFKLDIISSQNGHGHKLSTGGYKLWKDCKAGVKSQWRKMKQYNVIDVLKTEKVYLDERPWIQKHPHVDPEMGKFACSHCGSMDLQKRGIDKLVNGWKQIYHCNNCHHSRRGSLQKYEKDE
jgi:hypothetical protein